MGLFTSEPRERGYKKLYNQEVKAVREKKLTQQAKEEARRDARTLSEKGREGVGAVRTGAGHVYKNVSPKVTLRKDSLGRLRKLGR